MNTKQKTKLILALEFCKSVRKNVEITTQHKNDKGDGCYSIDYKCRQGIISKICDTHLEFCRYASDPIDILITDIVQVFEMESVFYDKTLKGRNEQKDLKLLKLSIEVKEHYSDSYKMTHHKDD